MLFKAGISPNRFELTYEPEPKYRGKGTAVLFDLDKGDEDFASGKWLGFQKNPMEITLKFMEEQTPSHISLSLFSDEASHIFLPERIEVWQQSRNGNWIKVFEEKPEQPLANSGKKFHLKNIKLMQDVPSENIRIKLSPVASLPAWHPSKGSKGWVFIDEILIN